MRLSARTPKKRGMRTSICASPFTQRCCTPLTPSRIDGDSPRDLKPRSVRVLVKSKSMVGWARISRTASASCVGRGGFASRSQQSEWTICPPTSAQPSGFAL
ncbi:hypothetical protein ACFPRL_05070 [Pseudoclavibacter helvolus]